MGSWRIIVRGHGPDHTDSLTDADMMAAAFADELELRGGQRVASVTFEPVSIDGANPIYEEPENVRGKVLVPPPPADPALVAALERLHDLAAELLIRADISDAEFEQMEADITFVEDAP